ncbi:hypothetical protein [Amycolatopsis thermophila]|uniref:DUF222 domain-containing protein n=1 Tax=Amycolatopsis thermophila TaxID=206084 RepID=A0ABU0EUT8_9PSEU|nr:hypothetical protein [Amycolatopsis thermophila]MDQ0379048.1 hypothetical protein [Amycolatopsis thermophila]
MAKVVSDLARREAADGVLTDERMDELDLAPRRQYRQRLAGGYDETHHALLRQLQTQQGERRNRPRGFWIAEASAEAAHHALVERRRVSEVSWAVLATDGAYNTMTHVGLTDWPAIAQAGPSELSAILDRCQQWERDRDPDARQFPEPNGMTTRRARRYGSARSPG